MIRRFEMADLDDALDAWEAATRVAHDFLTDRFFAEERRRLAKEWLPGSETYVHEADGRVVGFLTVGETEVFGLFVSPDWQRRGIGRQLLDHVRATRPRLELDVFEQNHAARAFYEAYGFRLVDRHVSDVEDQPELRLRFDADG